MNDPKGALPRLEEHPHYPLSEVAEVRRAARVATFSDGPAAGTERRAELTLFVSLTERFAFLEQLVQGEIRYELPVLESVARDPRWRPGPDAGEAMAIAELAALELGDYPALDLSTSLEERGIKIFRRISGAGAPRRDVAGAFYFEGEFGPAFLVEGQTEQEAAYVVAHELGHLVMDFDPYSPRCCRWEPDGMTNRSESVEERRADRFARAALIPAEAVRKVLPQILGDGRERSPRERVELLSTLFDVPPPILRRRLADLELVSEGRADAAPPRPEADGTDATADAGGKAGAETSAELPPSERTAEQRFELPPRFLHLALATYAHGLVGPTELGRFLGMSPERAQQLIVESGVESVRDANGDGC